MWVAGRGFRPGISYGSTGPLGFDIAESPTATHDLNATILHLLGIDHERLTYRYQGRDFYLTDVHGNVICADRCVVPRVAESFGARRESVGPAGRLASLR